MVDYIASLQKRLYHFISQPDYQPMKQHELARALNIDAAQRRPLRRSLQTLEAAGKIVRIRKNRWALPDKSVLQTGTLTVHPDGFGFITPDTPHEADHFVPGKHLGAGLHGDRVEYVLGSTRRGRRGGTPGQKEAATARVARIVERRLTQVAGIYRVTPHYAYIIPDNARIQHNIRVHRIEPDAASTQDQHRVVARLHDWTHPDQPLLGDVIEDLGPADAPGADMIGLLRSHGLEEAFPQTVESASRSIAPCQPTGQEQIERRDLRDQLVFTIDPIDARDFDDAIALQRNADGTSLLFVHIADVASYVIPGSDIDQEARQRGTSVYLVDRVIHMLPRYLTEAVCSLNPNEDRWTHTVEMHLSADGDCLKVDTYPSLIHSKARLHYEQVQQVLEGGSDASLSAEVVSALKDMNQLATLLRRRRERNGSILFEMPEVRCVIDDQGTPTAIVPRRAFTAYHLIEEFMLQANQAVARKLSARKAPTIYRVHEPPDEDAWTRMEVELRALGIGRSIADRDDMNAVARQVAGSDLAHMANLAMLRNLNRAIYSGERAEHFGLAFQDYLHFTSPIRRYPDLIVHRVLKAVEQHEAALPYQKEDVDQIARHCSQMEREADDAEQESITLKRIEYYANQLEAGEIGPYSALVTSMSGRGLLVELADTLQRGLVPFALLDHDHYRVNADRTRAIGRHTRHMWKVGDRLEVILIRVDTFRKLVDFAPADRNLRPRHMAKPEAADRATAPRRRGGAGGRGRGRKRS
jgi:ribonuclease R